MVVGNPFVTIMGKKIKDVFFKIRASATNCMYFVSPNQFRHRDTELRSAHGTRECKKHTASRFDVLTVGLSGVNQHSGVKMTEVAFEESRNGTVGHWGKRPRI